LAFGKLKLQAFAQNARGNLKNFCWIL